MIRRFLHSLIKALSTAVLKKYHPQIIAITGSIGKSSAKEACGAVLSQKFRVRATAQNYNTGIGVGLAILGVEHEPGRNLGRWLLVLWQGIRLIIWPAKKYPQMLILELAADHPGDIAYFMNFIKPNVGIVTSLSPVHLKNFGKFSRIVSEKRLVVENLPTEGWALLNYDDDRVRAFGADLKARTVFYGIDENAKLEVRAQDTRVMIKDDNVGLYFKLIHAETVTPIFVKGVCGKQLIYSLLAGAAAGFCYGLTAIEIANGLGACQPMPGRFTCQPGPNNTHVIDDTYNAAPVSTCAALRSLQEFPLGKRRIAVLADMLELGSYSEKGHAEVGECAAKVGVDQLLTYGERAAFISQTAKASGLSAKKVRHFESPDELIDYLRASLQPADVVLVKGSHSMQMDRVVARLLAK